MTGLTLVTAPAKEPVTIAEMKDHLRITDETEYDSYIDTLLNVARETVEHDTDRKCISQTWDYMLDAFPDGDTIRMPYGPLQSVTSLKYNDADSAEQTFSSANYTVDANRLVGRVVLKSDQSWPTVDSEINAVTIRFICGYGDDRADVPEPVRHMIKFLVMHLFDVREPVVIGKPLKETPLSYRYLMQNYKVHTF